MKKAMTSMRLMRMLAAALILSFCWSTTSGSRTPQNPSAATEAPTGLLCELLALPAMTRISDGRPDFGWIVNSVTPNDLQSAYRILVASSLDGLGKDRGDFWDSGKVASASSVNIRYAGRPLQPGAEYFWKVRSWNKRGLASPWSAHQKFVMADVLTQNETSRYPLQTTEVAPVNVTQTGEGRSFLDFGRAAFGFLRLELEAQEAGRVLTVHFGEKTKAPSVIDRAPGGSIRYAQTSARLEKGRRIYEIHPPADKRNTSGAAVLLPQSIGSVLPFRYVEIENCPANLTASMARLIMVHYPFDEKAARFSSDDETLNRIWELCRYSIKATTFCGVYVDGDRERIPYEADAYINQLGHYAMDREFSLARYSHEYLLDHPTWPTEWRHHSIFMAWADYLYTGNADSLQRHYDKLQGKTLEERSRPDGLLKSNEQQVRRDDIIDWPAGERDGFVHTPVNAVVNAFYYRSLVLMQRIAAALEKADDAARYGEMAGKVRRAFQDAFFRMDRGVYADGEGTDHASLHSNMFALAFGLAPGERREGVVRFVKSRGMACSVYGAQYLLEALYESGEADFALDLMTSKDVRGWPHMLELGSTITLEAWDIRFKPNLDWNHAWGAAPANIIPRYVMGVRPLEPGFSKVLIQPQPGRLRSAEAVIPAVRGSIAVRFERPAGGGLNLWATLPANMTARIGLPATGGAKVVLDNRPTTGSLEGGTIWIEPVGSGTHELRLR